MAPRRRQSIRRTKAARGSVGHDLIAAFWAASDCQTTRANGVIEDQTHQVHGGIVEELFLPPPVALPKAGQNRISGYGRSRSHLGYRHASLRNDASRA
jgi:hypothetical protein